MPKSNWKHFLTYFFLLAFTLLRVVNLHEYSHTTNEGEQESCELCAFINTTNESTALDFQEIASESPTVPIIEDYSLVQLTTYEAPFHKILLLDYFYNKPPPFNFWG
ncbi:hypothetical protein [Galbibacter mesophilus]|uniref:hypothetical protein n=1 Tax=Galbibacter mesophilus TaxID=379069 RepID=UPI00191E5C55|nr:hypothetical protein [Galbibacter mesophilus]MCM5663942.1 hypothetical protein [Galbibacter mesophilus]